MQNDKTAAERTDELIKAIARTLCRQDALRNCGKIGDRDGLAHHVNCCWEMFQDDAQRVIGSIIANGYQILPSGIVQE